MALDNYTDLQNAVADWLNRADLTARIPDFITFSEARLNRTLRVRDMIDRRQTTTTLDYIGMPYDFLEVYRIELPPTSTGRYDEPLTYISPDDAARMRARNLTGPTRYYTIIDGLIQLVPTPSDPITLTLAYYAKIPNLSDSNPTNWLLTKAPDLYLYTTLMNAAPYLKDDDRIQVWSSLAQGAFDELTLDSERAQRSRTNLTARRRTF